MAVEGRSRVQQNDLLLHEAVIKNEPAAVREALQRPTDVNCRNNVSTSGVTVDISRFLKQDGANYIILS